MKKSSSKKISKTKHSTIYTLTGQRRKRDNKDFTPLALDNLPSNDKQFGADGFERKPK